MNEDALTRLEAGLRAQREKLHSSPLPSQVLSPANNACSVQMPDLQAPPKALRSTFPIFSIAKLSVSADGGIGPSASRRGGYELATFLVADAPGFRRS